MSSSAVSNEAAAPYIPIGTLRMGVKKAEVDSGRKPGLTTGMAVKLKAMEREIRELPNEILRKASVYFAQAELDRRFKR